MLLGSWRHYDEAAHPSLWIKQKDLTPFVDKAMHGEFFLHHCTKALCSFHLTPPLPSCFAGVAWPDLSHLTHFLRDQAHFLFTNRPSRPQLHLVPHFQERPVYH